MKYTKGTKATLSMPISIKSIDKENFTLTMVASTQDIDRHGDVVLQSGWDLKPFNENPVILNSHNYGDVGEVIARATRTEIVGKGKRAKLEQDWLFAVKENPKAKIAFDLYAGGFLTASSVGFIPKKFKQNGDGSTDWFTIEEAELLEVSAVSVPANARALAKSKGIDIDMLELKNEEHNDDEGEDDEVPQDNEDETVVEEGAAEDGDSGEGKPEGDDEEADGDEGGEGDGESIPAKAEEDVEEVIPAVEVPQKSYTMKVAEALKRIETKEQKGLRMVLNILKSLDENAPNLEAKTQEQIRKRKINQSIRLLMKVR